LVFFSIKPLFLAFSCETRCGPPTRDGIGAGTNFFFPPSISFRALTTQHFSAVNLLNPPLQKEDGGPRHGDPFLFYILTSGHPVDHPRTVMGRGFLCCSVWAPFNVIILFRPFPAFLITFSFFLFPLPVDGRPSYVAWL